ncbi:MAG: alpha/beta fold hydrolase, partial [Kiloniellales bacterium]
MPTLMMDGRSVRYSDLGSGDAVILLHSGASSSGQWSDLCDRLEGRYRVLAPDFIGCGGSAPWTSPEAFHIEHEVALVRAVTTHCDGPFHLIGHSYGGRVALQMVKDGTLPVRSLALYEPNPFWLLAEAGETALMAEIREVAQTFGARLEADEPETAMSRFIDYWGGPGTWDQTPEKTRAYLLDRAGTVNAVFPVCLEGDIALADLKAFRVPTLLLKGGNTHQVTGRLADILARHLRAVNVMAIPGVGHMAPLTHPGRVNP